MIALSFRVPEIAKFLIVAGLGLLLAGGVVLLLARVGFHGLPGDVDYAGRNGRVVFPVVSCLLLSVALTAGLWLWQWLTRR